MDTDLLPDVAVADPDPGKLFDRSAGPALEPRRDAGQGRLLQKAHLEDLRCRVFQ